MKLVNLGSRTRLTTITQSDDAGPSLEERIPARQVSKILGVKVATLAKWRQLGKGPTDWLRISATCVVYSVSEIKRFLADLEALRGGDKR